MLIAVILALLAIASILFHFFNPWQATPLASNWSNIDNTLAITFLVCGIFFALIMAFMVYCLVKYRHREGHKAHYEPENKKLEVILSVVTTIGICAMLAPGLIAYDRFISPPANAKQIEVLGQQWSWKFRLPGEDGILGTTSVKHIDTINPFGINPKDPNGQDDILIASNQLHLPVDQPVNFILRSLDVLHNFYIPQFRAKMDMIPGVVTSFWATPTTPGEFEILCAELCGSGHFNMRGLLRVETEAAYQQWRAQHPTFAETLSGGSASGLAEQGKQLAQGSGCLACHSIDGSKGLAPTWLDLYGATEVLEDGSEITVDDAYLKESIVDPAAKIVRGYPPVMAAYNFSNEQLDALVAYTRSLSSQAPVDDTSAAERGQLLSQTQGCLACHSVDGNVTVGPSWKGLFNSSRQLTDGATRLADDDYLKESITNPNASVVEGFTPMMPAYALNEQQLEDLLAYIHSLADETTPEAERN